MSLAKKCDFCNKLYEPYNERNDASKPNGIMFLNIDTKNKFYGHKSIDCCPDCMDSIKALIESLKNRGEVQC